ncbi:hypothetical protein Tco_0397079 [Tanacetum coccineum]
MGTNTRLLIRRNTRVVKCIWIRAKEAHPLDTPSPPKLEEDDDHSNRKFISRLRLKITGSSDGAKTNSTGSRKIKMSEIPRTGGIYLIVHRENFECGYKNHGILGKMLLGRFKFYALTCVEELRILDELIDKGNGSDEIVNNHLEILGKLQQVNKAQASEVAQKAKIKWYVEGDENTKFFHGMLNKKRSQLNIRGIMINGTWTDNPKAVKQEFFQHFRNRFDKPPDQNAHIDMPFPNSLSTDQQKDLECMVSKEEVKRAVWDCGTDKSPGPDGFTFGFYRHFWSTIENDVFEAINYCISLSSSAKYFTLFYTEDAIFLAMNDYNIEHLDQDSDGNAYRALVFSINLCNKARLWVSLVDADRIKSAASKLMIKPFMVLKRVWVTDVRRGFRSTWTSIVQEVKKLQNQCVNIFNYIRIKIGNGDNTSFWKDKWHNEGVLKDVFPRIREGCGRISTRQSHPGWLARFTLSSALTDGLKYVPHNVNNHGLENKNGWPCPLNEYISSLLARKKRLDVMWITLIDSSYENGYTWWYQLRLQSKSQSLIRRHLLLFKVVGFGCARNKISFPENNTPSTGEDF